MKAILSILTGIGLCALVGCDKGAGSPAPTTEAAPTAKVATPTPSAIPAGETFGAAVSVVETTSIDALLASPEAFQGKTVRVEGLVTDVCPKRGCWFELAGDKAGQKLKFKVTDGEMVFPMDAKGKHAVAQGQVTVRELSLEESREYAAYQAKEYGKAIDPATITTPTKLVQIAGTGAVIRDTK